MEGRADDQFIQLTEGMVAEETLADPVDSERFHGPRASRTASRVVTAPARGHRLGLVLKGHPEQRFVGLGARHGLHVDQAGRRLQLGADRAYTGPDCPPDMLDIGGIPQGDYAPVPFVLSSRGWAAWIENNGHGVRCELGDEVILSTRAAAGPLKVHLFTHPTPAAQLRAFLRLTNSVPPVLPSGRTGSGRAATSTATRRRPRASTPASASATSRSTRSCSTPLGHAIQHMGVQPAPVPGRRDVRRLREDGVRTVVWVTPW